MEHRDEYINELNESVSVKSAVGEQPPYVEKSFATNVMRTDMLKYMRSSTTGQQVSHSV